MYKLDIRVDTKESAAIERRRIMEQQRQSRIFNARERTIGVDTSALSQQVAKRKQDEDVEKQRTEAHATGMKRADRVALLLEERHDKEAKKINEGLTHFRKEHQRARDRKEFDLNDPDSKLKDLPARVSDEDSRLTVSGMQVFNGEDLMYEDRRKFQQEQTREWATQQMTEKERLAMEEKQAQKLYDLKACELDQRAVDIAIAEEEARKSVNKAHKDYNLALAKEKAALDQQEKAQEEDDNYTELCNHIHGDILTENPGVAGSAFGAHRVIPDRWKGMSPAQLESIRMTQEAQKQEKAAKLEEERALAAEWDRRRETEARAGLILESQENKRKKELVKKLAEENRQLAASQKANQDYKNKYVYVNSPSKEYFDQFNTSSR